MKERYVSREAVTGVSLRRRSIGGLESGQRLGQFREEIGEHGQGGDLAPEILRIDLVEGVRRGVVVIEVMPRVDPRRKAGYAGLL